MTISLTTEQNAVVNADLSVGQTVAVKAFAGAGKTFTLTHLANTYLSANPSKSALYLAFNKSIQTEAESKFPSAVTCKTTHSLAFKGCGLPYAKANQLGENRLKLVAKGCGNDYSLARAVQDTVRNFMFSADLSLTVKNVPFGLGRYGYEIEEMTEDQISTLKATILERAVAFWGAMVDTSRGAVKMPHDGYLKLFQLEQRQLGFDLIMMDEAQDANPCTLAILENQKNCAKVLVGDDHQAIYQFRGSQNAFDLVNSTQTLRLSESFRFGPAVASVANALLSTFKNETVAVKGFKEGDSLESFIPAGEKTTIISRTNAEVFMGALQGISKGQSVAVVGGASGLKFQAIEDVLLLSEGKKWEAKDPFVKGFKDLDELIAYNDEAGDVELTRILRLINEHGSALRPMMESVKHGLVKMDKADLVLSTGHKCKGLEWENVIISDDFIDLQNDEGELKTQVADSDINLLYVACTRAEKRLVLNKSMRKFLGN